MGFLMRNVMTHHKSISWMNVFICPNTIISRLNSLTHLDIISSGSLDLLSAVLQGNKSLIVERRMLGTTYYPKYFPEHDQRTYVWNDNSLVEKLTISAFQRLDFRLTQINIDRVPVNVLFSRHSTWDLWGEFHKRDEIKSCLEIRANACVSTKKKSAQYIGPGYALISCRL